MKNEKTGFAVILTGIAVIGFIWFKRNKPTTANKQLTELNTQSNAIKSGSIESIDKPFQYNQQTTNTAGSNPYTTGIPASTIYANLTPAQVTALGQSVSQACPSCANLDFGANLTNQIAQNLQNSGLNQLSNYNFSNLDFSNIKMK